MFSGRDQRAAVLRPSKAQERRLASGVLGIGAAALLVWLGGHLFLSCLLAMQGQHELLHAYRAFCTDFLLLLCLSLSILAAALGKGVAGYTHRNRVLVDCPYDGLA